MAIKKNFKKVNFLKIDKNGYFYINHKEPVQGAEKVILKNGSVTYHTKYVSTEYGDIIEFSIREVAFNNIKTKLVNIKIKSQSEEVDSLDMPLYTYGNSLNPYVRGLCLSLDKITPTTKIMISCSKVKNAKGYVKKALYVFTDPDRKNLVNGYEGHTLPEVKKIEKLGSIVYDSTELDNYIYKILQEQLKKFSIKNESNTIIESDTDNPIPVYPDDSDEDNDLPF